MDMNSTVADIQQTVGLSPPLQLLVLQMLSFALKHVNKAEDTQNWRFCNENDVLTKLATQLQEQDKKLKELTSIMETKLDHFKTDMVNTLTTVLNKREDNLQMARNLSQGTEQETKLSKELASLTEVQRREKLMKAAETGNVTLVKALVQTGMNVSGRAENDFTALHKAAAKGQVEVARLLLDAGALLTMQSGFWKLTPLHSATVSNNTAMINLLLDSGAILDAQDRDGETALHWAVREESLPVLQVLVERGANMEARDKSGRTPLMFAKIRNKHKIADWLSQRQDG